ncbi:MAG: putative bifunctional diguanylate cyclase/phosphodiesterase [Actinomycetota bacterium]
MRRDIRLMTNRKPGGRTERLSDRLSVTLVGSALEREASVAVALILIQLVAAFTLTWGLGGTSHFPPHWFYFPILFAGVRFGIVAALPTAVAATILAGPLTPGDVASGSAQPFTDWGARGAFFVAIGATLPALMRLGTTAIEHDRKRLRTEEEVRRGIDNGEFVLYYQPIVELDTGQLVGAEALLRWQHPQRGLLMPDEFIDRVERIGSLASWVLVEAATAAAGWQRTHELEHFTVSVNVSAQNLAQPDFVSQVRTALRAAQLDPRHLCLELTERIPVDDLESIGARLQVLRSIGTRVSVDDFGTGHSTLSYLRQLPIDVIKIDRSFVSQLGRQPRADSIVDSLSSLARSLPATCVAEGVETSAERLAVWSHGIRYAQGYLFSRPLDATRFEEVLMDGGRLGNDLPAITDRPNR